MLRSNPLIASLFLTGAALFNSCTSEDAETLYPTNDVEASAFYNSTLKAIIDEKCISCHTFHLEGANRYDTFDKTKSSISAMLERVNATSNIVMPPADAPQLTAEEKAAFSEFLEILNADVTEDAPLSLTWTAYKYPVFEDRGPVSGTFDDMELQLNTTPENPIDVLQNAEILIDASSVNVGNDALRTGNVQLFFAAFTSEILGKIVAYSESEATINFTMNGISIDVPFGVTLEDDQLTLTGSIPNMSLFNWQAGYDALDEVCGELHENKVWEDIDLTAVIKL